MEEDKFGETLLFELLYRRDDLYCVADAHAEPFGAVLDCMGSI